MYNLSSVFIENTTFLRMVSLHGEGKMDIYCKNTHWLLRHFMFFLSQTFQHFYYSILRLLEVLKNSTQNYTFAVKYPKPSGTLKDIVFVYRTMAVFTM